MRQHQAIVSSEERLDLLQRLGGVGKLLGNGARFVRARDGVAAESDYKSFRHKATVLAETMNYE